MADAIHEGISAFFRSFAVISIIMIVLLAMKANDLQRSSGMGGHPFLNQLFDHSAIPVVFAGVELSSLIYGMLHFSPLSFKFTEYGLFGSTGEISYSIFSGSNYYGVANEIDFAQLDYFISTYDIDLYLKLAVIIPIVFLLLAGYFMKKSNHSIFITLIIFSLVYSLLTVMVASIGSIAINGEVKILGGESDPISTSLAVSLFKVFIGSFILSYVVGLAGSYLRKLLHKPVN